MTTQYLSIFFLAAMLAANVAMAVSPDELRELSGATDRQDQQRANRTKSNDVKTLIPSDKTQQSTSPVSNKYTNTETRGVEAKETAPTGRQGQHNSQYYAPQTRVPAGKDVIFSDSVKPTHEFGIRLGQWMEATLDRNSSNAEPGLVELRLTKDIQGSKRTLGAGTLLYATKSLNGATKRLDMLTTKGITPEGVEFAVKGQVFDAMKVSGLNGIMVFDKEQVAKHSLTKGALSAVSAAGQAIAPGNPAAAALRGASSTALTDTQQVTEFNNAQNTVIYVSPQPLLIRIDEKF